MRVFLKDRTEGSEAYPDGRSFVVEAFDTLNCVVIRVGSNRSKARSLSLEDARKLADALDDYIAEAELSS